MMKAASLRAIRLILFLLPASIGAVAGAQEQAEWFLMSRQGECVPISALERKLGSVDFAPTPDGFVQAMRQRGYEVQVEALPERPDDAMKITVAEKGLSVVFVRSWICGQDAPE